MFSYIKGQLEEIGDNYVVIENNDIGYIINTSQNSIANLKGKEGKVKLYTHLHVREDDISVFGFYNKEELDMFNLLLLVSKIGPKVALSILSTLSTSNIKLAIISNDVKTLSKAPGIGKKTANRLILELKDKIDDDIPIEGEDLLTNGDIFDDEVIGALLALGYTRVEANSALKKIDKTGLNTEDIIKKTLIQLSKS
ncbi:Holliday junction branch migration protein RuvA [Dethiothermospora halolimnae]|uniref:Holliday junction branch migration protein RuvA n=1 Tax=Dethiothermospora halolimnae TaxID=3114390 RepID=UPI003CCC035B